MRYFTQNPLERMMMQTPKSGRPETESPAPAPEGHHCFGCGRYGMACVRPCYRDKKIERQENTHESLNYR